jgi:hypothetical protein
LIARFYQRSAGEPTHYRWLLIPISCLVLAFIHNASTNRVTGDPLSHILWIVAGASLLPLCLRLYRVMTHGRPE